jgi:signal transduction histidine kinase
MTAIFRHRWPAAEWWDLTLAAAFLVACEAEVVVHLRNDRAHDHWPAAAVVSIVAGIAVALAARRKAPLASAGVAMVGVLVLALSLSHLRGINSPQLVLFVAPYSVAAYSPRVRAVAGLAVSIAAVSALSARTPSETSGWVFTIGVCGGSWVAGRFMRARRALAAELRQTNERIAAETNGREALAIAGQRTRIARELQILVAHSVSTMIVQSQAAQQLLDQDSDQADAAMASIEATGRHALDEMRRILGVLRHHGDHAELAPQPGVEQIPALIEKTRGARPDVTLHVEGKPGPLPASVDLAVYRLLAEALSTVADTPTPVDILLRFGSQDVTLAVTAPQNVRLDWPTIAMRERVALCDGTIDVETLPDTGERLVIHLLCALTGALT